MTCTALCGGPKTNPSSFPGGSDILTRKEEGWKEAKESEKIERGGSKGRMRRGGRMKRDKRWKDGKMRKEMKSRKC